MTAIVWVFAPWPTPCRDPRQHNGGEGRLGYGNVDTVGDDETPAMVGDVPLLP